MNRNEFIRYLKSFYLDNKEYYVIGSGILLLYGIIDYSNNIDLKVSDNVFKDLNKVFNLEKSKEYNYVYDINNILRISNGIIDKDDYRYIDNIPVYNLNAQNIWYSNSLREKDKEKVLKINDFLNRRG